MAEQAKKQKETVFVNEVYARSIIRTNGSKEINILLKPEELKQYADEKGNVTLTLVNRKSPSKNGSNMFAKVCNYRVIVVPKSAETILDEQIADEAAADVLDLTADLVDLQAYEAEQAFINEDLPF